ncbi:MAG: peptidylprolyl isomerase [Verrucomicrobiota bacterium]|nr:peptidylprolyl isomerase [Verrucomicrobiota bacterium]MDQ6940308.1 peptidylprolyl isomerase [Verrucomicrobiota bacterium]
MKRALWFALLAAAAIVAGLLTGEGLYRTTAAHRLLATLAAQVGFVKDTSITNELVRQENLQRAAREEIVSNEEIEREIDLLRDQFGDEKIFAQALKISGYTPESLRACVRDHLRAQRWIESQIASQPAVTSWETQQFYDANAARFLLPQRYRVRHIFLAAPDGYPDEVIAAKRSAIQGLSVRILAGEKFADLVTEASEDEATKMSGGDLGYFSAWRMPPELIAELEKLHVGEISAPIRSHLGFHIVQLTDIKNPEQMSFDKVRGEIASAITNEKRSAAVARLTERLTAQ